MNSERSVIIKKFPDYEGKPIAYLDQNILDIFVKNEAVKFRTFISDSFQVVYSNETLHEISRSTGYEEKFLSVLKSLSAAYLSLVVEQPGFIVTDQVTVSFGDPFDIYSNFYNNQRHYDNFDYAMKQFLFKLSGGRKNDSVETIFNEQYDAFCELLNESVKGLEELPAELQSQIKAIFEMQKKDFKLEMEKLVGTIKESFKDKNERIEFSAFREATGVGPKELNNISSPDVIKKIWELYKEKPPFNKLNDIDEFLYIKTNPVYPNKPFYTHQKVTGIYNFLNAIGYFPDSDMHKEKRFVAAMSDNNHASMASFCDYLLSRDDRFIKKIEAVFEYLEIKTKVCLITSDANAFSN